MTDPSACVTGADGGVSGPGLPGKRDIHYRSQDGLRLYAADYGPREAGLTVLCMHGLTRNHKDFEPLISRLDLPCRFLAVDVRGRGRSEQDPARNYTPQTYARDMLTLLNETGTERVALIGTSMGGLMAMLLAASAGERVSGIILNDIGPVVNPAGLQRIAASTRGTPRFGGWQAAADAIRTAQADAFPDFGDADWMDFARRTCRQTHAGLVEFDYDPAITRALTVKGADWRTNFMMWRLFGRLKNIPLLTIRGESSDILTPATARRMIRRHRNNRLVTVANRGHAPILSEPEAVSAIETFLDGQPGAR